MTTKLENKQMSAEKMGTLHICRSCLVKELNMFYLFDGDLKDNFSTFSKLEISQQDSLPHWICWQCYALLRKCIIFKNLCSQSMRTLMKCSLENDQSLEEGLKTAREKFKCPTLSYSKTNVFDYQPNKNTDKNKTEEMQLHDNINIIPSENITCENSIKMELKGDFDHWSADGKCHTVIGTEILDIKTEFDDNHFHDSDDEPVINKNKREKKKNNKIKKNKHKKSIDLLEPDNKKKKNILNTPAKNFDFSLVLVSYLSREQQLQELIDQRDSDEYTKAPYKCQTCARGFAHEIVYKEHCLKHEPVSGQYVCELCTQRFNTPRNLSNHLDTHASRYTCRLCNKVVISKQNIMSHMYTEHDQTNKQIKCEICQKMYKNRYTYSKHMRIHNSSKEYKCHLCPKVFLWKDNLNRHLTRHKSERPFKCDLCPKSFFLKENLKDHQLVHSGAKRFYCVECDLSYASQVKLNQHLKRGTRHLRPEQLTFACKLCDMRYTNSVQLTMHTDRVHLNKRSQACQLCDAAFVSKKTLQTHIKSVHEGYRKPRDHICETCGKGFSDKQVLKAHLRTHTGEKPYSCKYCGVKFAHSGAMYTHVKLVHLKLKRSNNTNKRKRTENCIDNKINPDLPTGNKVNDEPTDPPHIIALSNPTNITSIVSSTNLINI